MKPEESFQKVFPEGLIPVTDIDIRKLSGLHAEKSIYLSVYLPVSGRDSEHLNSVFTDTRVSAIRKVLPAQLKADFEKTLRMAESSISEPVISGERGRIIFACHPESFLHIYRLAVEPGQWLVLDTSPFLLPLARLRADYEDYGVLLVDSQEAKFTCIRSDIAQEKKHLSTELMNKHKKGGWSQMRFNHLRKEAIKSFLSEVADNVQGTCDQLPIRGIVVAGPGNAKQQLVELLPRDVQQNVLGIVDLPMSVPRDELIEAGDTVLHENGHSRSKKWANELKSEILKGGLGVIGGEDVRKALENGRVSVLLILKGTSLPGWKCESCRKSQAGDRPPEECSTCGGQVSAISFLEELHELARRTGAQVEFVEQEDFPGSDYVVGALLRY